MFICPLYRLYEEVPFFNLSRKLEFLLLEERDLKNFQRLTEALTVGGLYRRRHGFHLSGQWQLLLPGSL